MFNKIKIPKKLLISIAVVLAIIIVAYIAIKVVFGSQIDVVFSKEGMNYSSPAPSLETIPSDAGLTPIAENGKMKLEYSPLEDLIVITDLVSGEIFRSYPESTAEEIAYLEKNPKVKDILTSPVFVGYTQSGQEVGPVFGVNQMTNEKKANIIKDGLQLEYYLPEQGLDFVIEFYLHEDALEVLIPRMSIKESHETARLASLHVVPYLGSARQNDYGYMVTPDGSGALTYFNATRVTNFDSYVKKIYGDNMTFNRLTNPDYKSWPITMPVFGIVKKNSMITSYILEGDANSSIAIEYPGNKNLPFYSISFRFDYRQYYLTKLSKASKDYELLEKNITIGDVRQIFYFNTSEEDGKYTYVDVANKMRELLINTWNDKYGITKELSEDSKSVNVRIFMGDQNRWGGDLDSLKVMTTFEQVIEMYEKLEQEGVTNIRLSIAGWQRNGYYGNITKKFNPDSEYGGKKGFEKLTSWAKDKGVEVSFDNNLMLVYGKPKSTVSLRTSVVKKPGVHYLQFNTTTNSGVYRRGLTNYVLSPIYYEKKVMKKEINKLKDMGAQNIDLQQIGDNLFSDYNRYNALTRSQVADKYVDWVKTYQKNFDSVSVYYGNSYAVAVADKILNIPTVKSANMILDEAIPFIQIVYHGLIDYYSDPINNADDMKLALLKSIEYGAFFSYELTYKPTGDLKYTNYNKLFNSEFSLLIQDVTDAYKISEEVLMPLRNERIVNHTKLANNVFCTEYSNGSKVYVNYGSSGYIIPGTETTVDAMGYHVG